MGCADHDADVDVVAAGVHDACVLACFRLRHDLACVRDAGFFNDGQGIHVGADEEGGAGAVLQDADNAESLGAVGVFADVLGDGVAVFAEGGGEDRGGAGLVVGELGVGVEVFIGVEEGGELGTDDGGGRVLAVRDGGARGKEGEEPRGAAPEQAWGGHVGSV